MDMDGLLKWQRIEQSYDKFLRYGASGSPVIFDNLVIYYYSPEFGNRPGNSSEYAHLTAVDKDTGKIVWKVVPEGLHDSYCSLVIGQVNGIPSLLLVADKQVHAYAPANGRSLWSVEVPIEQNVPSCVIDEGTVYAFGGTHGLKGGVALAPKVAADSTGQITVEKLWEIRRGIPECSSPVLYNDLFYMVTDAGVVSCLDPQIGQIVWKKRLPSGSLYHSSLVAGDDKVYIVNSKGDTTVIRAGRDYEELAINSIDEEVYSSPAICNGDFFLRGKNHVFCIKSVD